MKAAHWIVLSLSMIFAVWFVYRTRDVGPRIETSIDLNWHFILGDPEGAAAPGFDDSQWRYVSVPHDWMIEQPVSLSNKSENAGGYYPGGIGWYRKSLDLSTYEESEQFYLMFEGVYRNADVYFNGTFLGNHAYGYSSFYFDISEHIRKDTMNIIAVRTDCSKMPHDSWYSGAGIFRPVKLIAADKLHTPPWGSWAHSTLDSTGNAELNVSTEIKNEGRKARRFEIRYDIVGPGGRLVAESKSTSFIEGGEADTTLHTFQIKNPQLWSPESPHLYVVNCYLMDGNKQIDHTQTIHGIRTAQFDPNFGFILNGEKKMLKGVCLHHDGGELGAAVPLESWRRRLLILKELGVNAIRLAHNPHAPGMLDLCDELGFMVINEMYDKWEDHWESDLANFVRRDRNHPCVILWSVENDRNLTALVRSIDPYREVSCGLPPDREFVAGQFIWSGFDYLGESVGWPDRGWENGLVQTNGFIKPSAWYIGALYREDPMVKLTILDTLQAETQNQSKNWQKSWMSAPLAEHWNLDPMADSGTVVVFTNCKRIDISLNNRLITSLERSAFPDGVIRSTIAYEPGELVARAFFQDEFGKERHVTDTLVSADEPYALAMQPDRKQVSANNREVVHITTQVLDSTGTLNPFSTHEVNYTLDGPGRIRVIDNGDLADHTPPGSSSREVRRGKQLLILQAGSEPGDLIINASADGLKPSRVKIKSTE